MYFDESRNEVRCLNTHDGTDDLVLSHQQVEAINLLFKRLKENARKDNEQIHKKQWGAFDRVFIAKYTVRDDYGDLEVEEVFRHEQDAIDYVLKKRDKEGATNISVLCRKVN